MKRRLAGIAALALVATLLLSVLAMSAVLRRSYPTVDAEMRLLGLDASAEVLRDVDGVPHIYARTLHDLFYVQGYVTAQDRLFQLDFLRRIGQGRLSEVFGAATLDSDRFLRTLGIYRTALREVDVVAPDTRAALQAYADGVNKFVDTHRDAPPIEFVLLGIGWEPWQPADSAVIGKIMAWDLGGNMQSELVRADVLARLGPEAARVLFPGAPSESPSILSPSGGASLRIPGLESLRSVSGAMDDAPLGLGSNSWVLSGTRTATGRPLLADDTHLALRNPSIWYLVHLVGAGFDVAGFTVPGAPGVVIGHNARIAWGVANLGPDVQDLYVEQPNPGDLTQFRFGAGFETAETRREEVRVKGRDGVPLDVTVTRHGPVLTPVLEGTKQIVALRWTALEPGHLLDAVYRLDRAASWQDFRAALRDWDVPGQNFVYADIDGHIGYQATGRIPIRAKGDGHVPAPGWTGEYEWTGFIAFDQLPSALDPPEGLIVAANQRVVASYPYLLSDEWDPGFRAQRIQQLLATRERWSATDLAAVQSDERDLAADRFLSFLRTLAARSDEAASAQLLLRQWDGAMRADSAAAAIYQAWFRNMVRRTFRDKLGDDLYRRYVGLGRNVTLALYDLARTPDAPWFTDLSDPSVRGRDAMAAVALDDALAELRAALGPDPKTWSWGRLHTVTFPHPLGVGPLERIFNVGPFPIGGDGLTVANGGYSLRTSAYAQSVHASQRLIVDLADFDRALAVYPTGQSGQPFAPHWSDMTAKWLRGQLVALRYSKSKLGVLEGRLVFQAR